MIYQSSVAIVSLIVIFINNFVMIIIIRYNRSKPLGYQTMFDKSMARLLLMNAIIPYLKFISHYCCIFFITFDDWTASLFCYINNYCVNILIAWFLVVIVFNLVDFEISDQKITQKNQFFNIISITIFSGIDYTFITDIKNLILYQLLTGMEFSQDLEAFPKLNRICGFLLLMTFIYTQIRIKKEQMNSEDKMENKEFKKNLKCVGIFVLLALIMQILVINIIGISNSAKVLYGSFLMVAIIHVLPLFIFIMRSSNGMKVFAIKHFLCISDFINVCK